MKRTALILIILTIISKFTGLFRDILLSFYYGTSGISDAYIISQTIPAVIFSFIGAAIATSYIPMYIKIKENSNDKEAINFTNNLVNVLVIICTVFIIAGIVFTDLLVYIFASGFEGETLSIAITFTRISVFGVLFTSLVHLYKSLAQIQGSYAITAFISIPMNLIAMFFIILSYKYDIKLIAFGTVIAIGFQLLILFPFIANNGYKYNLFVNRKDKHLKEVLLLALPVILGVAVNDINVLVDRTIASNIAIGGIAALNYSDKINKFFQGVFVLSISTSMYPIISKLVVNDDVKGLKSIIASSITGISLLILPSTIGIMIFSSQIVTLVFGRGAFDITATILTTSALFYYSIGMLGFGLREVLSRVFYSMQDTTTPMKNAVIGVLVNISLNIILSRYLGIGGLALATSIAATVTTIVLFISLRKKIGPFGMKQIGISFLKILFASLVMGGLAKLSFNYLTTSLSQNLSLLIAIGVGAVSYFVIIYFMKIEDVDVIVGAIKKKLGRGIA